MSIADQGYGPTARLPQLLEEGRGRWARPSNDLP